MILWCLEAGLVHQWKVRTWARMKDEQGDVIMRDEKASAVVTLDDLQSAFYLYLIILFLASFVFAIEIFWKGNGYNGARGTRKSQFTL